MTNACQRCSSERVLHASSHGRDCHDWSMGKKAGDGYLPNDFSLGGGDGMHVRVCLDCGQLQGKWPLPLSIFERDGASDE